MRGLVAIISGSAFGFFVSIMILGATPLISAQVDIGIAVLAGFIIIALLFL